MEIHAKVLVGKKAICDHLGMGISVFKELRGMGLPCAMIGNKWVAHIELIDEFIKKVTQQKTRQ